MSPSPTTAKTLYNLSATKFLLFPRDDIVRKQSFPIRIDSGCRCLLINPSEFGPWDRYWPKVRDDIEHPCARVPTPELLLPRRDVYRETGEEERFKVPCHEGGAAEIYESEGLAKPETALDRLAWVVAVADREGKDGALVLGRTVRKIQCSYHAVDDIGVVPFYPGHIIYPGLGIASLGGKFGALCRKHLAFLLVGRPVCSLTFSRLFISLYRQRLHI